jgi:hypothetical protein
LNKFRVTDFYPCCHFQFDTSYFDQIFILFKVILRFKPLIYDKIVIKLVGLKVLFEASTMAQSDVKDDQVISSDILCRVSR